MITDVGIEDARKQINSPLSRESIHEHNDCIQIAYEWLDAQKKTKSLIRGGSIKHLVEKWGGRYISQSDVEIAAKLHPKIHGKYPHFNISSRLTEPSRLRLNGIAEALTNAEIKNDHDPDAYKVKEETYILNSR